MKKITAREFWEVQRWAGLALFSFVCGFILSLVYVLSSRSDKWTLAIVALAWYVFGFYGKRKLEKLLAVIGKT